MSSAGTFPILRARVKRRLAREFSHFGAGARGLCRAISYKYSSYSSGAPERSSMRMQCRKLGLPSSAASDKSDLAGSAPENLTAVNIGPSRRNMLSYARIAMNI